MQAVTHVGHLFRLYWLQERSNFQYMLFNAVVLPGMMCYLGLRVAGDAPAEQVWWISGALTMGLGMTAMSQTGFAILNDRFAGRLAVLRTSPVPKLAYYLTHVGLAVAESVALVVVALGLLRLLGLSALTVAGFATAVAAAVCAGSALGGLGAALATRAVDFPTGGDNVALAGYALTFVSPVFWDAAGLPLPVRLVTWISPFTHVADLMRAVVAGAALPGAALGATLAMAALFNVVSYRLVRWQE